MKKEIADQLVAALRSDEYNQGESYLAREQEPGEMLHCCLGVLCEIAIASGVSVKRTKHDSTIYSFYSSSGSEVCVLPGVVVGWADARGANPALPFEDRDGHHESLATLNDSKFTFGQIADLIEAFYKYL